MTLALPPWSNVDPPDTGVSQVFVPLHRGCAPYHASRRFSDQFHPFDTLSVIPGQGFVALSVVTIQQCTGSIPAKRTLAEGAAHCLSPHLTEKIREVAA